MEYTEPTFHKYMTNIGDASVIMTGERYSGHPILDTEVKIDKGAICWISWDDRQAFIAEINDVISKYRI